MMAASRVVVTAGTARREFALNSAWIWGGSCVVSYLLGAIPNGYLIGRMRGVDVRTVGSGNIGATNVLRSLGRGWGALTFTLDVLKGFLPAFLAPILAAQTGGVAAPKALALCCGAAAVAGHNWPVYLRFKGGKGVATSAGALLGVVPACVGFAFVGWVLSFLATRYVSVASMVGAVVLVIACWVRYGTTPLWLPVALSVLGCLVIWRHRGNIQRLRQGTESRASFGRKRSAT